MLIPAPAFSLDTNLRPGVYLISLFLQSQIRLQTLFCLTVDNMEEKYYDHAGKKQDPGKVSKPSLMVMVQENTIINSSLNDDTKRNGTTFAKAQGPHGILCFMKSAIVAAPCKHKCLFKKKKSAFLDSHLLNSLFCW